MLKEMHAVLPARDLARARKFYHDMLDMDPAEEHEQGTLLTYRVGASAFDIYETENAGTAKNTQLCFQTDDLDMEMQRLRDRGVMFEEFEIPGVMKTENGVVADDEGRTAWFRDSEGNFICISQLAEMGGMQTGSMGSEMGGSMGSGTMGSGTMGSGSMGSGMGSGSMGSGSMGSGSMGTDSGRM